MNTYKRADRLWNTSRIQGWLFGKSYFLFLLTLPVSMMIFFYYVWCNFIDPESVAMYERRLRKAIAEKKNTKARLKRAKASVDSGHGEKGQPLLLILFVHRWYQ